MISAALAILESDEQRNELSEIYESNMKKFYSIAFSRLHNKQDTEDAIQDAFLAVAKNPDVFFNIPIDKRVSYINVIIRNVLEQIYISRSIYIFQVFFCNYFRQNLQLGTEPSNGVRRVRSRTVL